MLQESHSSGASASLLDGLIVPARVLSDLGSRIAAAGASALLNVEGLLSAPLAKCVDSAVSLTEALRSFSFNLGERRVPLLVLQVYINWRSDDLISALIPSCNLGLSFLGTAS